MRTTVHNKSTESITAKATTSSSRNSNKPSRLLFVHVVLTCNYPCQNDKWGESSGHETEDTEILGVFAKLNDANSLARAEAYDGDPEKKGDVSDDGSLFYWQDEEPMEWTARRDWVEKKQISH